MSLNQETKPNYQSDPTYASIETCGNQIHKKFRH